MVCGDGWYFAEDWWHALPLSYTPAHKAFIVAWSTHIWLPPGPPCPRDFQLYTNQYLYTDFHFSRNILQLSDQLDPMYAALCLMSPWRRVFLDYLCPRVLTLVIISFTFLCRTHCHLALYHAYLCFLIFTCILTRENTLFSMTAYWISSVCARKRSELEVKWRVTFYFIENPDKAWSYIPSLVNWVQDKDVNSYSKWPHSQRTNWFNNSGHF